MGFFNFIETFFFISLAITFVLIMMLVYHFKERLTTLEKKTETIMDIMNGFFKEMSVIKTLCIQSAGLSQIPTNVTPKIVVSDTDSEYDTETDDDEDEDEYSDDDGEIIQNIQIHPTEIDEFEIITSALESENELNIDVEIESNPELDFNEEPEPEPEPEPEIESLEEVNEIVTEKLDIILDTILEQEVLDEVDEIEKKETESEPESEAEEKVILTVEDYKKMDISELRTLVIQQGLVTDTKKLKKNELIRILTE